VPGLLATVQVETRVGIPGPLSFKVILAPARNLALRRTRVRSSFVADLPNRFP
jgi:hypothetical protein